jgi:FkbM family methyltransferase
MMIESLTALGVDVDVISSEEPTDEAMLGTARLRRLTRRLRLGFSWELVRRLREIPADVDAVVITSAMFMPAIALGRVRAPIVWDTNECETLHYLRARRTLPNLARLAAWRVLETWAAHRSAIIVSISDVEARFWRRLVPPSGNKLIVVPHAPPTPAESTDSTRSSNPDGRLVIFVGNLLAKHNAEAATWLVDNLAPRLPADVRLALAGPGTEDVPTTDDNVLRLGWVDDVDRWISASEVCLAPLLTGAGVKTKVLHYLSHGKPVVGTPVAFEGIEDAPGIISVGLESFTDRVLEVLRDPGLEAKCSAAQRDWLDRGHGRPAVVAAWGRLLGLLPSSDSATSTGTTDEVPPWNPARHVARAVYAVARRLLIGTGVQRWPVVALGYRHMASYLLPKGTTMAVPFLGAEIELSTTDTSMALGLRAGTYERAMRQVFARALRPGVEVLDVGANVGLYAVVAGMRVGPGGAVVAVEPLPEARELLVRNLKNNQTQNVTVLPVAAGDHPGTLELRRFGGEVGTTSAVHGGDVAVDVEQARLDDLLPHARFDVVKIDVEGYEYQALMGMKQILARSQPLLFLEFNNNESTDALLAFLAESFPFAWRADERRGRVVPVEYDHLRELRQANIIASARPDALIGLLDDRAVSAPGHGEARTA